MKGGIGGLGGLEDGEGEEAVGERGCGGGDGDGEGEEREEGKESGYYEGEGGHFNLVDRGVK